jgi:aryl-alcohol dehydrogenase-like predicted oxidoreductase
MAIGARSSAGAGDRGQPLARDGHHQPWLPSVRLRGGVEDALGRARDAVGGSDPPLRVHTKCVPDKDRLGSVDFAEVQDIVDRSLRKLRTDCLDLVQFHWWDYRVPRYLEILQFLSRLQAAGKIRAIGLTNFDAERVGEIVEAGFNIASIQMQYSPVDRSCEAVMVPLCRAHGIKIYTSGSLLGGFLSEVWLGKPALNCTRCRTVRW